MRTLSQQELTAVSGAGATMPAGLAAQIDAIKKALAAKGITIALDKAAGTITITTPQGTKTIKLPSHTAPVAQA
jgi:hypothetical protein